MAPKKRESMMIQPSPSSGGPRPGALRRDGTIRTDGSSGIRHVHLAINSPFPLSPIHFPRTFSLGSVLHYQRHHRHNQQTPHNYQQGQNWCEEWRISGSRWWLRTSSTNSGANMGKTRSIYITTFRVARLIWNMFNGCNGSSRLPVLLCWMCRYLWLVFTETAITTFPQSLQVRANRAAIHGRNLRDTHRQLDHTTFGICMEIHRLAFEWDIRFVRQCALRDLESHLETLARTDVPRFVACCQRRIRHGSCLYWVLIRRVKYTISSLALESLFARSLPLPVCL